MKSKISIHTFTLVLLLVFPLSAVGSVSGYAWCFGDDGRAKVEQATITGCSDKALACKVDERATLHALSRLVQRHCSPCSDLLIGKADALFPKRTIKVLKVSVEDIGAPLPLPIVAPQVAVQDASVSISRISQTILNLRTVVLLN